VPCHRAVLAAHAAPARPQQGTTGRAAAHVHVHPPSILPCLSFVNVQPSGLGPVMLPPSAWHTSPPTRWVGGGAHCAAATGAARLCHATAKLFPHASRRCCFAAFLSTLPASRTLTWYSPARCPASPPRSPCEQAGLQACSQSGTTYVCPEECKTFWVGMTQGCSEWISMMSPNAWVDENGNELTPQ